MKSIKTTFLIGLMLVIADGGITEIKAAPASVKVKQCGACHRFSKDEALKSAPDLFYAGDKFQKNWLNDFLMHPETIRLAGHTRDPGFLKGKPEYTGPHPALNSDEAQQISKYLMSLKILSKVPPLELPTLSKGTRARIKILFEREYGCIACHQSYNLMRQPRGGVSGPSLIDAGRRLRPEWVYQWLKNPKQFNPKGRMPLYTFDDETLSKITQYIMSHKKDSKKK